MSHKANHWLEELPADRCKPGAFRVLFHLCACHNAKKPPAVACYPSQETLRDATGLSNGGLNDNLNALEIAGLIYRHRTKKANGTNGPTYYILAFDFEQCGIPTPENGDGETKPANSSFSAKPTPVFRSNQLQSTGEEPVREPGNRTPPTPKGGNDLFGEEIEDKTASQAKAEADEAAFDQFWKLYPNSQAKPAARKAFAEALKETTSEILLDRLRRYLAVRKTSQDAGEFVPIAPYPQKWLRQKYWDNDTLRDARAELTEAQKRYRAIAAGGGTIGAGPMQ